MNQPTTPAAEWLPGVIADRTPGPLDTRSAAWLADIAAERQADAAYWEQFRARLDVPEPEPRRVRAAALAVLRLSARIVTGAAAIARRTVRPAPVKRGQINAHH